MEQWGATATASSAFGTGTASFAASQATGAPNVAGCTSSGQAWLASSTTAGQWLEVGYAAPAKAVGVRIHETGNAGTVTKVELVDEGGTAHQVWAGTDGTLCGQWLEVKLPETAYRVAKVKVTTKAQTQVDAVGLVTEPAAGPTATVGYEYDANGLRTRRSDAAGVTSYLLDGLSVVGTYDATGTRQAWYTQSPARIDEVLNVSNVQGKYWYQADALGSIYALTTASGAVQARGGYDVFGEPVAQGGTPVGQPYGFTGREHEIDSGLVYARARYLQPGAGRWTAPDPGRFVDGPNVYTYVRANPAIMSDPTGLVGTKPCGCGLEPLAYLYWELQGEFGDPGHHLARIIYAEGRNENDLTMLGIGQVVQNRTDAPAAYHWRDAPAEAISDFASVVSAGAGTQFNAYANRALWISPQQAFVTLDPPNCKAFNRAILAAMDVMLGRGIRLLWPNTVLAFASGGAIPAMSPRYWVTEDIGDLGGNTHFFKVSALAKGGK